MKPKHAVAVTPAASGFVAEAALVASTALLSFLSLIEILAAVKLIAGSSFDYAMLPVAAICAVLYCALVLRDIRDRRIVLCGLAVACAGVLISLFICGFLADTTWDGNAYHKQAVASLAHGWNPNTGSVLGWSHVSDGVAVFIDHYAHGTWFIEAALYQATGSIEYAKASTLIMGFATALLALWLLIEKRVPMLGAFIVAALLLANPIFLSQFYSFYVDAFMMFAVFALALGLIAAFDIELEKARVVALSIAVCSFILASGAKFTGFAYSCVFALLYFVAAIIRWRKDGTMSSKGVLTMPVAAFCVAFAFSFFVVGRPSYLLNCINFGNPFYPVAGDGAIDIMSAHIPRGLADASTPERLFYSYFGRCDAVTASPMYPDYPELKIPLTFSSDELKMFGLYDLRQSGFGPLYSGVVLLSLFLIPYALVWSWRNRRDFFWAFAPYLCATLLLTFAIQDSWWARYSGYAYGVSLFVAVFAFCYSGNESGHNRLGVRGGGQSLRLSAASPSSSC